MYLDYREKFELFIVRERDSEVRKTYLEKNMCTAHNFVRLSLLRSVALQRLSLGDRAGEVRKPYLDYGEVRVIY